MHLRPSKRADMNVSVDTITSEVSSCESFLAVEVKVDNAGFVEKFRVFFKGAELEICASGISDAGNGLFTTNALNRGDVVGFFTGKIVVGVKEQLILTPHEISYTRSCQGDANLKISKMFQSLLKQAGFIVSNIDAIWVCGLVQSETKPVFPMANCNESNVPNMVNESFCELVVVNVEAKSELTTSYGGQGFEGTVLYTVDRDDVSSHYRTHDVDVLRDAFNNVVNNSDVLDSWLEEQVRLCVAASETARAGNWFAHVEHDDAGDDGILASSSSKSLLKYLGHDNALEFPWIENVVQWKKGSDREDSISATEQTAKLFLEAKDNAMDVGKMQLAIFAMIREVAVIVGRPVVLVHPVFHFACQEAVKELEYRVDDCFKWAFTTILLLIMCQDGFEESQPKASVLTIRDPEAYKAEIFGHLFRKNTSLSLIRGQSKNVKDAFAALKATIQAGCAMAQADKTPVQDAKAYCGIFAAWLTLRLTVVEYEAVSLGAYLPWDMVVPDDASWFEPFLVVYGKYGDLEKACKTEWQNTIASRSGKKRDDVYPKSCPTLLRIVQWDLGRVYSFLSSTLWDMNALSNVGLCVDTASKVCLMYDASGSTADSNAAIALVKNLIRAARSHLLKSFLLKSTEAKIMADRIKTSGNGVAMPLDEQWALRKFKEPLKSPAAYVKGEGGGPGPIVVDAGAEDSDVSELVASEEDREAASAVANVACKWPKRDAESVWKTCSPKSGTWIMSPSSLCELIGVLAEKIGAHRRKRVKQQQQPLVEMSMAAMQFYAAQGRLQQGGNELEKLVLGADFILELLACQGSKRVAWLVQELVLNGNQAPMDANVQKDYLQKCAYYMRRLPTRHGQKIIAAKDDAVAKGKSAPWTTGVDLKRVEVLATKAAAREAAKEAVKVPVKVPVKDVARVLVGLKQVYKKIYNNKNGSTQCCVVFPYIYTVILQTASGGGGRRSGKAVKKRVRAKVSMILLCECTLLLCMCVCVCVLMSMCVQVKQSPNNLVCYTCCCVCVYV